MPWIGCGVYVPPGGLAAGRAAAFAAGFAALLAAGFFAAGFAAFFLLAEDFFAFFIARTLYQTG